MLRRQCFNTNFYSSICRINPGLIGIKKGKDFHLSLSLPDLEQLRTILLMM